MTRPRGTKDLGGRWPDHFPEDRRTPGFPLDESCVRFANAMAETREPFKSRFGRPAYEALLARRLAHRAEVKALRAR